MKVLMFGWEFPPHISGGLGTACYGLTQSLGKEDTEVLFVVPKLHGDEPSERISLINASGVKLRRTSGKTISQPTASDDVFSSIQYKTPSGKLISVKEERNFSYIEIPSGLSAYRTPAFEETSETVEHWNYQLDKENVTRKEKFSSDENLTTTAESTEENELEYSYNFSGAYGQNLLLEVERYAEVAAEIANAFSFDVIHAHDWMTYPAGVAAQRKSGKPLVVHVHATEFDRSGGNVDTRVYAIEQFGMSQADCVVTVSEWTKKIAVDKYNIPETKVKVVHNGIIPQQGERVAFDSPLKQSPIVTFLGRITHQKGPLYFVEAARKVLDVIPDARFVVAGSGDLLPVMIQRVAQLKMSSRFHFTGFLRGKEIDKVWSMSNVYVMPSVSEPFGIAPLEAIQAGVPVVISKQSGVAEVMPHAIAVDFWNTADLANAICGLLQYKSLHRTLQHNGATEISNITWDNAARKLNTLYHELVTEA